MLKGSDPHEDRTGERETKDFLLFDPEVVPDSLKGEDKNICETGKSRL